MPNYQTAPIRQTTPEEEAALQRLAAKPVSQAPALPKPPPGMRVTPIDTGFGTTANIVKPQGPVGPRSGRTPVMPNTQTSALTGSRGPGGVMRPDTKTRPPAAGGNARQLPTLPPTAVPPPPSSPVDAASARAPYASTTGRIGPNGMAQPDIVTRPRVGSPVAQAPKPVIAPEGPPALPVSPSYAPTAAQAGLKARQDVASIGRGMATAAGELIQAPGPTASRPIGRAITEFGYAALTGREIPESMYQSRSKAPAPAVAPTATLPAPGLPPGGRDRTPSLSDMPTPGPKQRFAQAQTPASAPTTAAPAPVSPPLNVPYSPVGPNQVEADIGRPLPPPGMVEVIRPNPAGGFQFTNELGGDIRPVGMDDRTAREMGGFRNAGLTPPDAMQGVEILRRAQTDARQADAQMISANASARAAEADMIRATTPQFQSRMIQNPDDPSGRTGKVVYEIARPDGTIETVETGTYVDRPMRDYTTKRTIEMTDPKNRMQKLKVEQIYDSSGQLISEQTISGKEMPDIPQEYREDFAAAYDEAIKSNVGEEEALQIAMDAVRAARQRQRSNEDDTEQDE